MINNINNSIKTMLTDNAKNEIENYINNNIIYKNDIINLIKAFKEEPILPENLKNIDIGDINIRRYAILYLTKLYTDKV